MKKALLILLATSLLFSTLAVASGSSGSSGVPSSGGGSSVDPYKVTETLKCVVTEIKSDGTVMVRDSKKETAHVLSFSHKTRLSAQDKKAFDGRKELEVADLKVGQQLKVVMRQVNGEVLRVRVLKST